MSDRAYATGQTQYAPHTPVYDVVPSIVHDVLRSPGQTLNTDTRAFMETRFGHDFSGVRVHTDAKAAESAQAINARAYTVGRDVVFGANQYAPHFPDGLKTLSHELTHVVQQGAGPSTPAMAQRISQPGDSLELEADHVSSRVMDGGEPTRQQMPISNSMQFPLIQRQPIPVPGSPVPLAGPYSGQNPFPAPPSQQIPQLARELQTLIDGATWKEIRKRVYPKESAAGIKRAKERKQGTRPDLTGLGRIKTLEHFATAVRGIQAKWTGLSSPDDRVKEIRKAANVELKDADVPEFLDVVKVKIEFKGFFTSSDWIFHISDALVSGSSLSNNDAADLANTALHESRHAEQTFLAARFSAGINKNDAAAIVKEQGIPTVIADKAVAMKMGAKTDPTVLALGKQMYQTDVTDAAKTQAIEADDGLPELADARKDAETALSNLKANGSAQAVADATTKRDALRKQITVVEQKYTAYRNLPNEADAHEVGDAAEQAFKGWP